jgi:hypothetical protein
MLDRARRLLRACESNDGNHQKAVNWTIARGTLNIEHSPSEKLRKAAALRNEMRAAGFTDNGGDPQRRAHSEPSWSVLNYPELQHINKLRHYPKACFPVEALAAYETEARCLSSTSGNTRLYLPRYELINKSQGPRTFRLLRH